MLIHLVAASVENVKDAPVVHAGKAIALALGIGAGAAGAGAGIGNIFGSMIQSVARQPELRGEIMGLMFLGLALTEAITFYALLMGFVAFFLFGAYVGAWLMSDFAINVTGRGGGHKDEHEQPLHERGWQHVEGSSESNQ